MDIIFKLKCGVDIKVTPLNGFTTRLALRAAAKQYPVPDPAGYIPELPSGMTAFKSATLTADDNPEYIRLKWLALEHQQHFYCATILKTAVTCETKDALVAEYAAQIEQLKRMASDLPEGAGMIDDFITLLLAVLFSEGEIGAVMRAAQGALDLSDTDIIDGLAYFRSVDISRSKPSRPVQKPQSPYLQRRQQRAQE